MSTHTVSDSKSSEADYLRLQAEQAKLSMTDALHEATAALVEKADPRTVTRKHPVVAIVTALLGGFVAALLAIPSKKEQELRRLERLQRAMYPGPAPQSTGNGAADGHPKALKPGIGATLLHEAIALIKPILLATITAGIKSATETPPPPPSGQAPPNQTY
jgi:hypothetical protein